MRARDLKPMVVIDRSDVVVERLNAILGIVQEHERKIEVQGNPNWKQLARALYAALLAHRADMHGASGRPCATCHQSAVAIRAYDEAINAEGRSYSLIRRTQGGSSK